MLPDLFGNKGHKRMQKRHKILKDVVCARMAMVWDGRAGVVCDAKFSVPVAETVPNEGVYFMTSLVDTEIFHIFINSIDGLVQTRAHPAIDQTILVDTERWAQFSTFLTV